MKTEILHTIENIEDGFKVLVAHTVHGFSVTIQDTDSGEFLFAWKVFPDVERAVTYAKICANPAA